MTTTKTTELRRMLSRVRNLPTDGPISASMINEELGRPANQLLSLDDPEVRALAEVPSGTISYSDFYGKGGTSELTPRTNLTHEVTLPSGTATTAFAFIKNGEVEDASFAIRDIWHIDAPAAANPGDYEIFFTVTQGTPSFGTPGVWLNLAEDRPLGLQRSTPGVSTLIFTAQIRAVANQSDSTTATYTCVSSIVGP